MTFDVNSISGTVYSFVTSIVSIINSFLAVLGKSNEPYVVILIAVTLGWFVQGWIRNSKNPTMWFVALSLLIYATLRWFAIGG